MHALRAVLLLLLIPFALTVSCRDHVNLPPVQGPPLAVPEAKRGGGPGLTSSKPLRVAYVTPKGALTRRHAAITVTFNQPVVPLARVDKRAEHAYLAVKPPIAGKQRWLGSRTLALVPDKPLPGSTRFELSLRAGIKALSGQKLAKGKRWSFTTPRIKVSRTYPIRGYRWLAPTQRVRVAFNQPVTTAMVAAHARFKARPRNGGETVVRALVSPYRYRGGRVDPKSMWLQPATALPKDAAVTLEIDKALRGREGSLSMKRDYWVRFRTYGPLRIKRVGCSTKCDPAGSIGVYFSNPVQRKIARAAVRYSGRRIKAGRSSWASTYVYITPKMRARRSYTLTFDGTLRDRFGQKLSGKRRFTIKTRDYDPYARLAISSGVAEISGDKRVSLAFRNASSATLYTKRLGIPEVVKLAARSGFRSSYDAKPLFSSIDGVKSRQLAVGKRPNRRVVKIVDVRRLAGKTRRGVVAMELHAKVPSQRSTIVRRVVVRLTDIGMTAKYSPHGSLVWVTSLSRAKPVAGADVAIWRPGADKPLWRGKTDKHGLVSAPGTLGLGLGGKERSLIFTARHGKDETFVRSSASSGLGPWTFGYAASWDAGAGATLGMVFSERGIYRPGETAHVKGLLRRRGKGKLVPPSGKVKVRVADSRGEAIKKATLTLTPFGSFDLDVKLPSGTNLGRYSVRAEAPGGGVIYGSFRVEEYRPAEFAVSVKTERPQLVRGDTLRFDASGRYLFGAPMRRAKQRYTIYRTSASFAPPKHRGYVFRDEAYWYGVTRPRYGSVARGSGRLDNKGRTSGSVVVKPPRMTVTERWRVEVTVTDISRQTVASRASALVHPGTFYIGARPKETFLKAGETLRTQLVAVKPDGTRVVGAAISGTLLRREWRQVRKQSMHGSSYFVTRPVDSPTGRCAVTSAAAPRACDIKIARAGYYILKLNGQDKRGNPLQSSFSVYVSGKDYVPWRRKGEAKVELVLDRKRYKVGQTARVMIKSPFARAHALLTVESNGIHLRRALYLSRTATFVRIPVTRELLPNAYVSVLMVRGRVKAYRKNKKSPSSDPGKPVFKVGYAKLVVNQAAERLAVTIKPEREKYRPGQTANIELSVRDAKGKPVQAELTVTVADEGVLSLVGYRTPDPMGVFYAQRGLSVRTADNRNALIHPADFGQKGNPGGGGVGFGAKRRARGRGGKMRSRFVSTPLFKPRLVTGADGKARVSFKLPDNLTTFRVMVVAASRGGEFGNAEDKLVVAKPLLLLPTLPRLVRVGDEIRAGVVVHNHSGKGGDVQVSASASGVELIGSRTTTASVGAGGAVEARFRFRATQAGTATFSFRAKLGDFDDGLKLRRPVKLPLVVETVATSGSTEGSAAEGIVPSSDVRPAVGGLSVTMSSSALVGLKTGMSYLLDYPYECLEQSTSRLVPLVLLSELSRAFKTAGSPAAAKALVAKLIGRIQKLQRWSGGFSYWSSSYGIAPWASAYATWGLLQAKKAGHRVSKRVLDKAARYLTGYLRRRQRRYRKGKRAALSSDDVGPGLSIAAYGAHVLVEMGKSPAAYINGLYNDREQLSVFGKAMLMSAMARCKKCKSDGKAIETLKQEIANAVRQTGRSAQVAENLGDGYAPLFHSNLRSSAMVLSALLTVDPKHHLVDKLVRHILDKRKKGRWRNTQETAYALMALQHYFKAREKTVPDFVAKVVLDRRVLASRSFRGRSLVAKQVSVPMKRLLGRQRGTFGFVKQGQGRLHYTAVLRYARKTLPTKGWDEGFFVTRTYERISEDATSMGQLRGSAKPGKGTSSVKAGDLVRVTLRIVVPQTMHFVAVVDPLPAGLEPVNFKLMTATRSYRSALRYAYRTRYGKRTTRSSWYTPFYHRQMRDDRVQLFADSLPPGSYTYVYLARATTVGRFVAPPTQVEQMYEPEVFGRTGATTFTVRAR